MSYYITLIGIFLCTLLLWIINSCRRPANFPPGPKWYPLIGNTYQLRAAARSFGGQHNAFGEWSKKYKSPVIGLKLGSEYVVVALTYPLVRDIHTREEFIGRPDNFFLRLRTMGTRLGITCTDGSLWTEHRNFATRQLRQAGYGRLPMEMQIQNELNELIDVIRNFNEEPVWPASFLAPSVINVLWTLIAGKRIERNDKRLERLLELLQKRSKAFDISGGILTHIPWIRFIAPERSGYNLLRRFNMELHEFFMETINDHKRTFTEKNSVDDFIYAFLKEMNDRKDLDNNTFTDVQLTMTILDMFIAGSQTTSNNLDLALMMMVVRPDVQTKVIEEIDANLLNKNLPSFNDKGKLPYTEAVIMECQRYFHITPISGPRRTLKTTNLAGYTIPKNSTVLIGLDTVLMDEDHWKDPENFRPERFITPDNKTINDEFFMPFGQGKRRCLGESLARACLFTFFVGIMQMFNLKLEVDGKTPDMKLLPGITLSPRQYKIKFVIR